MTVRNWKVSLCSVILAMMAISTAMADSDLMEKSRVLAVIPLTKAGVNQNVLRQVDKMVPELKKIKTDNIIKLECRYSGAQNNEKDVLNAYVAAGKVEKYLREHHKLDLDIWVAANIGKHSSQNPPALTFSIFSEDVKNIDKIPVNTAKKSSE